VKSIKQFIGRLLFPARAKFVEEFSVAFVRAVEEIQSFDGDVKNVCTTWLAVCPHTYFSDLFLESRDWSKPFGAAFDKSGMLDPQGCFTLTQAYYLRHLKRLITQDSKYKKFSPNQIDTDIRAKMAFGNAIITAAAEFEEAVHSMRVPEDFSMCYIEKILSILYPDEAARSDCSSALWLNSEAMLGLAMFTSESLKIAKQIDSQSGVT